MDDDITVGAYYEKVLSCAGFHSTFVQSLTELEEQIRAYSFDVALLDLNLGDEDGFDGLDFILKNAPFTKTYVLTNHGSIPKVVEAMRRGAHGFFEKEQDSQQLVEELTSAVEPTEQKELSGADLSDIGLIGQSPAIQKVIKKIERLKDVDSLVLLLGESGTGKEVFARAIHRLSRRANKRFDAINCGAIPESLLESELFGHKRGSFTDAKTDRKGIFELCTEGTLLLDEIGDMPLSLQTKLLRVLQEREVTPVGSSTSVKIGTRVIAATHRNILQEVEEKRFREDLYFRLSIIVLHIPPLRERREDIPLLVEHFLNMYNRRFDRTVRMLNGFALNRMVSYDWPGNIRELQNSIERAVVLASGDEIEIDDVFLHLQGKNHGTSILQGESNINGVSEELLSLPLGDAKQHFEKIYLEHHLGKNRGQVAAVAKQAGRYRADIYRMLTRYGIDHAQYFNQPIN